MKKSEKLSMDDHKKFMDEKVQHLLKPLMVDILKNRPGDVLEFIVEWCQTKGIQIQKNISEHKEIKKMPTRKEKSLEALSLYQINKLEGLIDAIGSSGLDEFMEYIHSPWKMLWPNFVAGIARGFGALVGAAIVVGLIGWTLSTLIDLPLIGKKLAPYIEQIQ